jgi:hypothetical protein
VQSDVRSELARLNEVLSNELSAGPRPGIPAQRNNAPGANGANGAPGNGNQGRRHGKPGRDEPVASGVH